MNKRLKPFFDRDLKLVSLNDMHKEEKEHNLGNPLNEEDTTDSGDDTQRRFRYQYGYGVILLVGIITGKLPYKTLWCEHYEDFLAERNDGGFDVYQIKTVQPNYGKWDLRHDTIKDIIKKFLKTHLRFRELIKQYYIVSNNDFSNSDSVSKKYKSPINFLNHIKSVGSYYEIESGFKEEFNLLLKHCECNEIDLFQLLKKIVLEKGPSMDNMEAEVAHNYISKLPDCSNHNPENLNKIRDEIFLVIYKASSITLDSIEQYYNCIQNNTIEPRLSIKRINIDEILFSLKEFVELPFRYLLSDDQLKIGGRKVPLETLRKKMTKGGISNQINLMEIRATAADRHMIELAYRKSEDFVFILNQITNTVQGQCDESYFINSQLPEPFGAKMLMDLYIRIKEITNNRPHMVENQEYECLMGIIGLLSEDCKVWWSKHFEINDIIE